MPDASDLTEFSLVVDSVDNTVGANNDLADYRIIIFGNMRPISGNVGN
jgi:hypothetical protein